MPHGVFFQAASSGGIRHVPASERRCGPTARHFSAVETLPGMADEVFLVDRRDVERAKAIVPSTERSSV